MIQNLDSEEKYEKLDSIPSNTEYRYSKVFSYNTNYHLKILPKAKKSSEVKTKKQINVEYFNSNKSYDLHSFGRKEEVKESQRYSKDSGVKVATKQL